MEIFIVLRDLRIKFSEIWLDTYECMIVKSATIKKSIIEKFSFWKDSSPFLTGLGRTGVFIAVDVAIRQLEQAQTVKFKESAKKMSLFQVGIAGIVEKVRETRARSVMNPWQYAYINLLVAEKVKKCLNLKIQYFYVPRFSIIITLNMKWSLGIKLSLYTSQKSIFYWNSRRFHFFNKQCKDTMFI